MNLTKKNIKYSFEKLALFFANKSVFIIISYTFICLLIGFGLIYFYVLNPLEKEFSAEGAAPHPDLDSYNELVSSLEEEPDEIVAFDIFNSEGYQGPVTEPEEPEEDEESEEVDDEEVEEKDDEEAQQEETQEDISNEDLESALARNLFELYEFADGELPSVSERALIWEDLGIGDSDDYYGTYRQNLILLEHLREEVSENN